jgi:osmotically-inducible protein OsmY
VRQAIIDELRWDPAVEATRIAVSTSGGAVTLNGAVRTYAEKCRAEEIVKRMRGVTSVRNELDVRVTIGDYRTDPTLTRIVGELLESLAGYPEERPRATVKDAWVTLEGEVVWAFQKRIAEEAVRGIAGIRGITNRIRVRPVDMAAANQELLLAEALRRRAIDVDRVAITVAEGRIVLCGTVKSCAEHDELLDLAWRAAGVRAVEDHLEVR